MIFNSDYTTSSAAVTESAYDLGIGGALMHVYENECNFNSLMKAVGLSELKYYNETGKDLFVNEAGAFSNFIAKAKAFFKKVIEKIKSIFRKFFSVINSYVMSDKDFVKKYEKELYKKNLKDFEFKGYKFNGLSSMANISGLGKDTFNDSATSDENETDIIDKFRATLIGESGDLSAAEFTTELKNKIYGEDKEDIKIDSIRTYINIILNTKNDIKDAEKLEKDIIKQIESFIRELEKSEKAAITSATKSDSNGDAEKSGAEARQIGKKISLFKGASNVYTVYFGAVCKGFKDRNRQAKAICVKALSYKVEESAYYESSIDDIFANVTIK